VTAATLGEQSPPDHADGIEQVRTERLDHGGRPLARRCRSLVGHQVRLWVEVQVVSEGGKKVRVLQHIEDLGAVESEAAA